MSDSADQLAELRADVTRLGSLVEQIVLHRTVNTDGGDYSERAIDKRIFQQYTFAFDKLIVATQNDGGAAAARAQTEQLYLEEIRWRYDEWRTRYVPLVMQSQHQQPSTRSFRPMEHEELFFVGLQHAVAGIEPSGRSSPATVRSESWSFRDLRKGLQTTNDLLLLGPPGGGKTTALWRLALDLADDGHDQPNAHLPIFVRLGGRQANQSLLDLLQQALTTASLSDADGRQYPLPGHQALVNYLPPLLADGRLVLLWDGLNETPRTLFAMTAHDLDAFRLKHPGRIDSECNQSVITCRSDDYALLVEECQGSPPLAIAQATIQGLDQETVRMLILRRLGDHHGSALLDALALPENRVLAELARTPLLLTMLCFVYTAQGTLPGNRGQLIETFVQQRTRWEQQHAPQTWLWAKQGTRTPAVLQHEREQANRDQERLFGRLAYAMTAAHGRGTAVPIAWADQHLTMGAMQPHAIRTYAYRADLLEPVGAGGLVRFTHQLLQEYFAATQLRVVLAQAEARARWPLIGSSLSARVYQRYAVFGERTGWEETLLLLAGLEGSEGRAARLIRTFLSDPLRAAQLLVAGGAIDPLLGHEVQQAALRQISDPALPARVRVAAGRALALVGDPRPGVCDLPLVMVAFAGRPFVIGNPPEQAPHDSERNTEPVDVAAFALARYPLTNAQYQQFMDAGGYRADAPWWDTAGRVWLQQAAVTEPRYWRDNEFGIVRLNHPVVGVSWYEAMAYCRWLTQHLNDGFIYRLPSELEWEYAARGNTQRMYSWGNEKPNGERANFAQTYNGTTAVGCFPTGATLRGLLDLAGNVWEWTRSEYRPYPYDPDDGREDTTKPAEKRFTFRGGGWDDPSIFLCAFFRDDVTPDFHGYDVGFRLARHKQ